MPKNSLPANSLNSQHSLQPSIDIEYLSEIQTGIPFLSWEWRHSGKPPTSPDQVDVDHQAQRHFCSPALRPSRRPRVTKSVVARARVPTSAARAVERTVLGSIQPLISRTPPDSGRISQVYPGSCVDGKDGSCSGNQTWLPGNRERRRLTRGLHPHNRRSPTPWWSTASSCWYHQQTPNRVCHCQSPKFFKPPLKTKAGKTMSVNSGNGHPRRRGMTRTTLPSLLSGSTCFLPL